jgi:tetratricopeptide (TPR) repeat protein
VKFLSTLIAVLLLAGPLAGAASVTKGRELYLSGDFEKAKAALQQALKANPSSNEARLWLGYTLLALEQHEEAIRLLEKLRPRMSSDEEYLFSVSEAYTRESRNLAQRLMRLGQRSARAQQHLAYRYHAEGNLKQAIESFRRATSLRPDLPGLHLDLAGILWEQEMYEEAAAELRKELTLNPHDFLANLRIGQYLLREKKDEEAIPHLILASRHRKYPEAFQLLAFAYRRTADPAQAAAAVNAGLEHFPGHPGLEEMKRSLPENGQKLRLPLLSESVIPLAELRRRLAANPSDEDALFLLSRSYSVEGQIVFEELEQIAPDSYRVLQGKGLEAEYTGDFGRAEEIYRAVLKREPQLPGANFAVGQALRMQEKHTAAIPYYEQELALDPKNHLALYGLGSSLIRIGRLESGIERLEAVVRLRPEFPESKAELGKAYLQAGRAKEAVAELLDAVKLDPEHPSAHYVLFRAYVSLGEKSLANSHLARHQAILRNSPPSTGEPGGMGRP